MPSHTIRASLKVFIINVINVTLDFVVDMRKCLGYFPRDTIATYNSELSSCPNDASAVMDDCMGVCAELYAHP